MYSKEELKIYLYWSDEKQLETEIEKCSGGDILAYI